MLLGVVSAEGAGYAEGVYALGFGTILGTT